MQLQIVSPDPKYSHRRFSRPRCLRSSSGSPPSARPRSADAYGRLLAAVTDAASELHVMAARCVRSLGDVDRSPPGLFLFFHFTCEDPEVAIEPWEHLAGWYVRETGLEDSTLLVPIDDVDYVLVNHARRDKRLLRLAAEQLSKKTFRCYVAANLRANLTVAMPVLYRLA